MIDKNPISLSVAQERLSCAVHKANPNTDLADLLDDLDLIGGLMAISPEIEKAAIGYLLAVRKQEEE